MYPFVLHKKNLYIRKHEAKLYPKKSTTYETKKAEIQENFRDETPTIIETKEQ